MKSDTENDFNRLPSHLEILLKQKKNNNNRIKNTGRVKIFTG